MNKKKLLWKEKNLDDLNSEWIEAKVPCLGWTYIIDESPKDKHFMCSILLTEQICEEIYLTKAHFSDLNKAKKFCENHLTKTYIKLQKYFDK
jgi:hypothetical protein